MDEGNSCEVCAFQPHLFHPFFSASISCSRMAVIFLIEEITSAALTISTFFESLYSFFSLKYSIIDLNIKISLLMLYFVHKQFVEVGSYSSIIGYNPIRCSALTPLLNTSVTFKRSTFTVTWLLMI